MYLTKVADANVTSTKNINLVKDYNKQYWQTMEEVGCVPLGLHEE